MGKKIRYFAGLLLAAAALLRVQTAAACSLALHDWKLTFYVKIPVSAPLFPLAEINSIQSRLQKSAVGQVFWIGEHSFASRLAPVLLPFFPGWPARLPWQTVDAGKSLAGLARASQNEKSLPVIVGSDRCFIKVALFSDANAYGSCQQLVIMQSNRIRAVFPDKKSPWAQEINGQSWVSLIFYQLPVPGRILSFSAYPVDQVRASIYEDHSFVETLLSKKKLLRRPDLVVDPYAFDFPELPE